MLKLSVIVPAYNEVDTILAVLETVRNQSVEGVVIEVIVIDDRSTDGTPDIVRSNPNLYDRFLPLPKNLGKGGAVKAGLKEATGDYILVTAVHPGALLLAQGWQQTNYLCVQHRQQHDFTDIYSCYLMFRRLSLSRTRFPWTQNWLNRSVQGGPEHDRQF